MKVGWNALLRLKPLTLRCCPSNKWRPPCGFEGKMGFILDTVNKSVRKSTLYSVKNEKGSILKPKPYELA